MVRLEQLLKEARIQRGLTLEEAAKSTKIKAQFLEAIERGAYTELPSPAYAKGFVRNYAEFLGLPKVQTSALFKRDFDEKRAVKVLPDGMVKSSDFPLRRINLSKVILGLIPLFLLVGFLIFQTRSYFFPPFISLVSPKEGSTVAREVIVQGKTEANAIVTVNNAPISVNDKGEFVKKITLFPGETSITVTSKNRMDKESTIKRQVTVK